MTNITPQLRRKNRTVLLCLLVVIGLFYSLSFVKFGAAARSTPKEENVMDLAKPKRPSSSVEK